VTTDRKLDDTLSLTAMTTLLTYTVRLPDKCATYNARIIAVNSTGISIPSDIILRPTTPTMNPDSLQVLYMLKNWVIPDKVVVSIDYATPAGWSKYELGLSYRVDLLQCQGPIPDGILLTKYYQYDGDDQDPIQLFFPDKVLKSNCLFQLQLSSIDTACNTSTTFDPASKSTPSVTFRLNCDTVDNACQNTTAVADVAAPVPTPSITIINTDFIHETLQVPDGIPPGINIGDNPTTQNTTDAFVMPPPPLFVIGDDLSLGVSVIEVQNGSNVQIVPVNSQNMLQPMCELDMFDVQPAPNPASSQLIDLTISWLERQPLPALPTPNYFDIRYGPIVRNLVQDDKQNLDIIPGYETIMRTGDPSGVQDPTRHIVITGLQRNSLIKFQICAIYDRASEVLIQWPTVKGRRLDLAALEPFLELEPSNPRNIPPPQQPINIPQGVQTEDPNDDVQGPVVIIVDDNKTPNTFYWLSVVAAVLLILATALVVFTCLTRTCHSQRRKDSKVIEKDQNAIYFVDTEKLSPANQQATTKTALPA